MDELSPCVNVCQMADGECIGCGRTRGEIARWRTLDEEEKKTILTRIADAETAKDEPPTNAD